MRPLATVGNVNVDLILGPLAPWPQPGTEALCPQDDTRIGGAAGNAALAWQAMGVPFQIGASTGSDMYGDWLRAGFGDMAARWPRAPGRTTLSVGVTHPDGERTFLTTAGHLPGLSWRDVERQIDWPALAGGRLLLCGCFLSPGLAAGYDALFDRCAAHGIGVALDTGWPLDGWSAPTRLTTLTWVARSEILLLNEIEAMHLSGAADVDTALEALAAHMPDGGIAAIKRGPLGAIAMHRGRRYGAAAPPVTVIDTIGAGDIFNAAFLAELAQGDVATALARATRIASRAVSTHPRQYLRQETPA
ncbi:carbohydrate kinase [Salipiger aestuarii]|nr:carbohydrate kinase [Salipiger aestuarii]KAA8613235.1 carbohydrate kinase [Salipiger aestuarii]KAB2543086.1 carbohydrate kinase [Salipiger aestuarii]